MIIEMIGFMIFWKKLLYTGWAECSPPAIQTAPGLPAQHISPLSVMFRNY